MSKITIYTTESLWYGTSVLGHTIEEDGGPASVAYVDLDLVDDLWDIRSVEDAEHAIEWAESQLALLGTLTPPEDPYGFSELDSLIEDIEFYRSEAIELRDAYANGEFDSDEYARDVAESPEHALAYAAEPFIPTDVAEAIAEAARDADEWVDLD